jgi:hypothetical protein
MSRCHTDYHENNLRTLRVHYQFHILWSGMCSF